MIMPTHGPGHLKGFDYTGLYRYFLAFCCDSKRRVFESTAPVELVRSLIRRVANDEQFSIPAYCFMPDHLHLLVEGLSPSSNALRFIARSKQFSGFYYRKSFGQVLWQRYGFEHVLRADEDSRRVARYILENPVRGGLVTSPEEYAFLGSGVWAVKEIL
jgi:putative transposase